MNILMIAINDPAGTAISFAKAINQYSGHTCRLVTKEIRYNFMFEKDLHLPWLGEDGWDEVQELLHKSDVFHFHMTADEDTELGRFRPRDYMKGKIIVHHHHGHPDFRANPEKYRHKYFEHGRKNILVSTPDLMKLLPEASWQPNLVPVNDRLYLPNPQNGGSPIVIGQSVTRKEIKNTEDLVSVVTKIKQNDCRQHIKLDIIENTKHQECLVRKNKCHLIFDHMQGYFGVSSLESLSQGKPVIAGLDKWNIQCIKEFTGVQKLPWVLARNQEELEIQLEKLVNDSEMRSKICKHSRRFMESNWNEKRVLKILFDVYKNGKKSNV